MEQTTPLVVTSYLWLKFVLLLLSWCFWRWHH